ncbi:uncharacterized protein ACBR49_010257 [Aulostomus maculatus]
MEDSNQLEDRHTKVNMRKKMEIIKRQRQLVRRMMEVTEQFWENTQRERNETELLKAKLKQQQDDIDRLTAEKHKRDSVIKSLEFQMTTINEKLEGRKNEGTQEKMFLLQKLAEINQEREILESRRHEIISEQRQLEVMKYDMEKSDRKEEPKDRQQKGEEIGMLKSLRIQMNESKKIMLEVRQAKEQMEKNMAYFKQELNRNRENILQHKLQIKHIKHNLNVATHHMKQRWTQIQGDVQMQESTISVMQRGKERKEEEKETLRLKLTQIQEEMETLWRMLEDSGQDQEDRLSAEEQERKSQRENMTADPQKQGEDSNASMKMTWKKEKSQQAIDDPREQDIKDTLSQTKSKKDMIERIETKTQTEGKNLERYRLQGKEEMEAMMSMGERMEGQKQEQDAKLQRAKKVIRKMKVMDRVTEVKKRKWGKMVREHRKQSRRDCTEERSQVKWINFHAQKKRRQLDQRLERTMRERDELEILKMKIQKQSLELEQKLEATTSKLLSMTELKANIKRGAVEMENTWEKMHSAQRTMEENMLEVRLYMDKLTCMKAQIHRWKLFKFPEDQRAECLTEQEGLDETLTREGMSLQESLQSDTQPQRKGLTKKERKYSAQKAKRGFSFVAEEQNISLQIHEEILMHADQEELVMKEKQELEIKITNLKTKEEKVIEKITYCMEDMEKNSEEIKRLIMEVNDLQSQRPEAEIWLQIAFKETGTLEEERTDGQKETEHIEILGGESSIFRDEIIKYATTEKKAGSTVKEEIDEVDFMRPNIKQLKHRQEPQKGGSYAQINTESTDIQRLKEEIHRTREIIQLTQLELENQAVESTIDRNHTEEDSSEIEKLVKEMKEFQEFFKMVKHDIRQTARKQKKQLDQRLERTMRERDQLDILKMKVFRQNEVIEQKMEKMRKMRSTIEELAFKNKKKSEYLGNVMKETEVKMGHIADLNFKIEATKQDVNQTYVLVSQETARLKKFKTEIMKKREYFLEITEKDKDYVDHATMTSERVESDTGKLTGDTTGRGTERMEKEIFKLRSEKEKLKEDIELMMNTLNQKNCENEQLRKALYEKEIEREEADMLKNIQEERENVRQQAEAERNEMKSLKGSIEKQKQKLDETMQVTKSEIQQMELLKSELEIKRKQSEQTFRKSMRKQEAIERMWNELQGEKKSLRRETKKRKRELDQSLERAMRERDELEVIRKKMQRERDELTEEKKPSIKDETIHQHSKATDFMTDFQNMKQNIHACLEAIKKDINILRNVDICLGKQREGLNDLTAKNKTLRENVRRIKIYLEKEMEGGRHMTEEFKKQKQELDIRLTNVKRETREMELVMSELEKERRENQQMMRKGLRKEQEVKKMCADLKDEKAVVKRETQRRKKELDQCLERVARERDELEMMKLKLQRDAVESRRSSRQNDPDLPEHWELIKTFLKQSESMKRHSEDIHQGIQEQIQHIAAQAIIINQARNEVENMKMYIKSQKDKVTYTQMTMQPERTHQEQHDIKMRKVQKQTGKEKEITTRRCKESVTRGNELDNDNGPATLMLEAVRQKEKEVITLQLIKPGGETKNSKRHEEIMKIESGSTGEVEQIEYLTGKMKKDDLQDSAIDTGQVKIIERSKQHGLSGKKEKMGLEMEVRSSTFTPRDEKKDVAEQMAKKKKERDDLDRQKELRKKETRDLELMSSDMKEKNAILEQKKRDLGHEKGILETTKTELQLKKEQVEIHLDEIMKEKSTKKDVVRLKEMLQQEREDLDRLKEHLKKERRDLELMSADIKEQNAILEREKQDLGDEKGILETTKTELQLKKEQVQSLLDEINKEKTTIKALSLQVQTRSDDLEKVKNVITSKQQEQELKSDHKKKKD